MVNWSQSDVNGFREAEKNGCMHVGHPELDGSDVSIGRFLQQRHTPIPVTLI